MMLSRGLMVLQTTVQNDNGIIKIYPPVTSVSNTKADV